MEEVELVVVVGQKERELAVQEVHCLNLELTASINT